MIMKKEHPTELSYFSNEEIRTEYVKRILLAKESNKCFHCGEDIVDGAACKILHNRKHRAYTNPCHTDKGKEK